MNKPLSRQEKVQLLKTIATNGKPELDLWILHAPFGIIDPDRNKTLLADQVEMHIRQVQQDNPLYRIVVRTVLSEEYNQIVKDIEAII